MKRKVILSVSAVICLLLVIVVFLFTGTHIDREDTNDGQVYGYGEDFELYDDFGLYLPIFGKIMTIPDEYISSYSNISKTKLGNYNVNYSVHFLWWSCDCTDKFSIADIEGPEIKLLGESEYGLLYNQEFVDPGYKAVDDYDGIITDDVVVEINDDVVSYTAVDRAGNSTTVYRILKFYDMECPVITLSGSPEVVLHIGDTYQDAGCVAIDNKDGDITDKVNIESTVDTSAAGEYYVVYTVTDSAGNTITAERIVKVVEQSELTALLPSIDGTGKVIYLTFDDGPSEYTGELLDVLAKYNVKATFFVVNSKYNNLLSRIVHEGHAIGIHSYTHDYKTIYSSTDAFYDDLYAERSVIFDYTGINPTISRFPGGSSNAVSKQYCTGIMSSLVLSIQENGFQYFDWNVSSGDAAAKPITTEAVINNIVDGVSSHQNSIVLQHDTKKFSVDAVETIIVWGLENGFTFSTLSNDSFVTHHSVNN